MKLKQIQFIGEPLGELNQLKACLQQHHDEVMKKLNSYTKQQQREKIQLRMKNLSPNYNN